ncbi:hypothetical protein NQ314_001638 [Rhamnusium bicolor]|uniref:Cytochrome c oxidase subunit IV n=1 Tax=Rhamnusium bicolor TaxID=1586634 RepID=A0AAV8ZTN4_9CUCU|nr:hypothetical protein NQ314_001638 [Rhamnusium bicolor]
MAGTHIVGRLIRNTPRIPYQIATAAGYTGSLIGKREVVGFGFNGEPNYVDRYDFPMPAIRWKEPTPEILALRQKEKGDWNRLSLDEKKRLVYYPVPDTFDDDKRRAQLRRYIDLQANPIQGLASTWDYDKDDWKR